MVIDGWRGGKQRLVIAVGVEGSKDWLVTVGVEGS